MKKSLIAVAVAGLFAAPVAMAEVTLSGAINLGIELGRTTAGTAPGGSSLTTTSLNSHYSHVDLESVDDIGGGNKIVFHYQLNAAPQNVRGINDDNRNSFLGVVGDWGAFKMGSNENVYERMMYTADPMDGAVGPGGNLNILGTPGAGNVFEVGQGNCGLATGAFVIDPATGSTTPNASLGTGGCVGFYRRSEQTIWYESPNFGGFSFEVDYTLSAFKTSGGTDPKLVSIGGKFQPEGAPFYIDLAYEKHDDMFGANRLGAVGGTGSSDTGIQVGGGWMMGDLGLHLRYERLNYNTEGVAAGTVSEYKRNAYWFGVKYNLPSGYVGGELGIAQEGETNLATAANTGAKMFAVGYFHNLSKQSQLQFIYGRTDNDSAGTYAQIGSPNGGVAGADHQVIALNLKHTF